MPTVSNVLTNTISSVQKINQKIISTISKKLLTRAFSRHIIGVASEQKKCTEAKNEQKQTIEQKLHIKRPFLAGGRFFTLKISGYLANKR